MAIAVVSLVVPQSTATNRVDNDEEDEEDDVDDRNFLPRALDVVEETGFARFTVEAELLRCVVPDLAVWIRVCSWSLCPVCGAYVCELALI